jgi:hypothetical protein
MHREVQPIVVFDRISNIAHGKFMRITSPSLHRGANAGAFFSHREIPQNTINCRLHAL